MHFTRDPIIETIISPKDGHKLAIRNSNAAEKEEYLVNALEVVSFGSALFFRSLEKPKAFLLPIADYEVVEVKESRMSLKNVSLEKPIKIGDGKDSKEDKESSKKEADSKKGTKKKTSKKKNTKASKSADKEAKPASEKKEAQPKAKEVAEGESVEPKIPPAPAAPLVFPTPPKVIVRKLPDAEEQHEELKDELVSDSEPLLEELDEQAAHHPEDEFSEELPSEKEETIQKENQNLPNSKNESEPKAAKKEVS